MSQLYFSVYSRSRCVHVIVGRWVQEKEPVYGCHVDVFGFPLFKCFPRFFGLAPLDQVGVELAVRGEAHEGGQLRLRKEGAGGREGLRVNKEWKVKMRSC